MKVCSLYGAGFYYMPGTDICIKIGGYVRFQMYGWGGSNGTFDAFVKSASFQDRLKGDNQDFIMRTRAIVTFDTRQQTEFGTLRTYSMLGYTHDTGGGGSAEALYAKRGFIQLAGFTLGKAQSFYDIFSNPAVSYYGLPGSDTGDGGALLAAYTAQFGNGFTGTISLEDPVNRRTAVLLAGGANGLPTAAGLLGLPAGGTPGIGVFSNDHYGNMNAPDVVGVLRVDQAWGSAQVMAAAHEVRADYYDAVFGDGHPSDKWGWVAGAGGIFNMGFINPGDKFQFQVNYTEGALRYLDEVEGVSNYGFVGAGTFGFGFLSDGVYSFGSGINLTKGLEVSASYDHVWNQRWKTSLYGGYMDVRYGDTANALLCGTSNVALGCDANWSYEWVGTRTQFNINASTYLGLDVIYQRLNSMSAGGTYSVGGGRTAVLGDQDNVGATFRVHRDFLP